MGEQNFKEAAEFIRNNLRMKTFPVAVKFLKDSKDFPEKTRRPSQVMGKRVAICQAVTMARLYGWTIGLTKEDLICIPAAITFGFSDAEDPASAVARLLYELSYSQNEEAGVKEATSITRLENGEYEAVLLAPLHRATFEADTLVFYGNPAQIMRFVHAWSYLKGEQVQGSFGGKITCSDYLIVPFKEQIPRVTVPGMGDRTFSITQDDEMVFSMPGSSLTDLIQGLKEAGSKVGAKYPVSEFLNYEPEFPKYFTKLGKELGIL